MTETVTTQNYFTPMKGHVMEGVTVRMNDGRVCTIKQNSYGWVLQFDSGELLQLGFSAFAVEHEIFNAAPRNAEND